MLHVFVCEDDAAQRKAVVQTIQNTVLIEELDMQLVLDTADPYELLEAVRTSQKTGIYFLTVLCAAIDPNLQTRTISKRWIQRIESSILSMGRPV